MCGDEVGVYQLLPYIEKTITSVEPFTMDEVKQASALLTKVALDYEKAMFKGGKIPPSGPCVRCKTQMQYGKPKGMILRYGYVLFVKARNRCAGRDFKGNSLGGYDVSTVRSLLCQRCLEDYAKATRELEAKRQRVQEESDKSYEAWKADALPKNTAWLAGQYRLSDASDRRRRDSALLLYSQADIAALPYKVFLASRYWKFAKDNKFRRSGMKCGMCHSGGRVDVHHSTYEHHGEEHRYPDDLIVLCRACHQKFHDKLPVSEQ